MHVDSLTALTMAPVASAPIAEVADPAPGFLDALRAAAGDAIGALSAGEAAAVNGLTGAAPAWHVADAMMHAQQTLQTALSIRDKLVGALQEITRMAI